MMIRCDKPTGGDPAQPCKLAANHSGGHWWYGDPQPCPASWDEQQYGTDCDLPRGHEGPHRVTLEWEQAPPLPLRAVQTGEATVITPKFGKEAPRERHRDRAARQRTQRGRRHRR